MKSIITLALAVVAAFGSTAANHPGFSELDTEMAALTASGNSILHKAKYTAEENIPNPATYISSGYVKSNEDVIKCDNEVIESDAAGQEVRRLVIERTFFDVIDENNRIVDGTLPDVAPLDFAYINSQDRLQAPVCQPRL